jgi:hypothetical protein
LILGFAAFAAVVLGVVAVIVLARRQATLDASPTSQPSDFVAPVSSGGYRWRKTDESPEAFKERVAQENASAKESTKPG